MGWFDTQIQERRACDEALMASTVEALSAAIEGKRGGEIGAQRMLPDRELEPRDIYRFVFEGLGVYDWTRVLLGAAAASLAGMVLPAATAFVFTDVIPSVMANAVDHADLGLLGPLLAILLAAGFAQAVIGALRALLMGGMVSGALETSSLRSWTVCCICPPRFLARIPQETWPRASSPCAPWLN